MTPSSIEKKAIELFRKWNKWIVFEGEDERFLHIEEVKDMVQALTDLQRETLEKAAKICENFPNQKFYAFSKKIERGTRYMTLEKQKRIAQAIRKSDDLSNESSLSGEEVK